MLNAAHDGRIDTLLVRPGVQQWGRYDAESRSAAEEDESTAKNYDLLDLAVVKTLQADGRVVFIEEADWDSDLSVAAICRYPLA